VQQTDAPTFDEDNLPEDFLAAHKWQAQQLARANSELAELRAAVGELQELGRVIHDQRQEEFDAFMDGAVLGLGDEDLGTGPMLQLPPDSDARKHRASVAEAYWGLCLASGIDPLSHDGEMVKRAYHAVFHDKLKTASQRKLQEQLRDAKGRYISPSRPSSGKAPPKPQADDDDEMPAEAMARIKEIVRRGGKT
jgi:hypothetical protein